MPPAAGPLVALPAVRSAAVTGCTGSGRRPRRPRPSPASADRPSAPRPPAPAVGARAGRRSPTSPGRLSAATAPGARSVGRADLSAYVDAAFLRGRLPPLGLRAASFGSFTPGGGPGAAARPGAADQPALGPDAPRRCARPGVRRTSRCSRPRQGRRRGHRGGRPGLRGRPRRPARRSGCSWPGRLLLTRDRSGRWRIFGYDLRRSQTPVGSAS